MKRGMLALAAFLGLGAGLAHAQYIVIVLDLNAARPGGGQGNQGGAMGLMGGPPMGVMGNLGTGGPPMPGGAMGAVGAMGNPGPGFNLGTPGGPMTNQGNQGGGALGAGGAKGAGGAMGAMGAIGGPGLPPPGGPGGMGPYGPGGEGGALGMFGGGGAEPIPPLRVMAVVEYTHIEAPRPGLYRITHKWGQAIPVTGQFLKTKDNKNYPPTSKRYEDEFQRVIKKGMGATTDDWLAVARWALEHELLDQYTKVMDGLVKSDPTNPKVDAYAKVKEQLAKPLAENKETNNWKRLLYNNAKVASRDHYDLIHWAADERSPEVKTRLDKLENSYKGYYYWFALKGQVMPMPKEKMVAVLVRPGTDVGEEFRRQNKIFDSAPINMDSFFARRNNLVVFSAKRLDEPFELLEKSSADIWKVFDRDTVMKPAKGLPQNLQGYAVAQTYSLLIKSMEEDSERAAVGQQGTRQIIASSGLLPRNVQAPEWIQSGMGSLFETPPGSPWGGYGAPHWAHLFAIEDLKKKAGEAELKKPEVVLKKVITDTYFRASMDKTKGHNGDVKARATAWALTYFLASEKPDGLLRYFKEISKLPRDLELEDKALTDCFTRAFGTNLANLANEWARFIENVHPDAEDILKELYKIQNELALEMRGEATEGGTKPGSGGSTPGSSGPSGPYGPGGPGGGPPRPGGPMGGPGGGPPRPGGPGTMN